MVSKEGGASQVVILGAGCAGIAAAVRLADQGVSVTLVEAGQALGGRAAIGADPETGRPLDSRAPILTRAFTHLLDLYHHLGVDDKIRWSRSYYVADGLGQVDEMRADDLPAPLHLMRPLLTCRTVSAAEKFAIARGLLAVLQVSRAARSMYANESFADWLKMHGQTPQIINNFWRPMIVTTCNEQPEHTAAHHAIQALQEGVMYTNDAYEIGTPICPLHDLYDGVRPAIEAAGGRVMLGGKADQFVLGEDGRVSHLLLADRQELFADAFISAVPFDRVATLATPELIDADSRFAKLDAFHASPTVAIHLFYERARDGQPRITMPHVGFTDSPVHWAFNKGEVAGANGKTYEHLHCSVNAAYDLIDTDAAELIDIADLEVRKHLKVFDEARLVRGHVIKDTHATFSPRPGLDVDRPTTAGSISNLFLAGDWCATGWPPSMESAARSGYAAADAALQTLSVSAPATIPCLEPDFFYRVLSG